MTASKISRDSDEPRPPLTLLLTTKEAAEALRISTRKLWSLTNAGEIPSIREGRRLVRYRPQDLERWIERNKSNGHAR